MVGDKCFYFASLSYFSTVLNLFRMPGPVSLPGGKPSSFKYICEAEGCGAEIRATDLASHYSHRTNYNVLQQLKTLPVGTKVPGNVEKHTKYMFEKKHSKTNLPNWRTHRRANKANKVPR